MARYMTVLFEINDDDSFKPTYDGLFEKFVSDKDLPWRVVAISLEDEFTKLQALENQCEGL